MKILYFPLEQFEITPFLQILEEFYDSIFVVTVHNQDVVILVVVELVIFFSLLVAGIYGGINRGYFFQGATAVSGRFPTGLFINYLKRVLEGLVAIIPILFQIILVINILALIPGTYCFTAQFSVTAFLSGLVFFGAIAFSILWGGWEFPLHFIPGGVPTALKGPLAVIEVISYTSRLFSLAIRLFANLVAGHSLLHILGSSTLGIAKQLAEKEIILLVVAIVPLLITGAVYSLESGIAGLQAYVFLVLSLIYLREVEHFLHTLFRKKVENDEKNNLYL